MRMRLSFLALALLASAVKAEEVAVRWGVADASATVGRATRIHVPADAFSGDVAAYEVGISTFSHSKQV